MARILIVEDDLIIAAHLEEILKRKGHLVTAIARTGRQALDSAKAQKPDLVLMDMLLADRVSGIEVAFMLESLIGKSFRIIYLTALPLQNFPEFGAKVDECRFINKPFVEEEVLNCIEKVLAKRKKPSN